MSKKKSVAPVVETVQPVDSLFKKVLGVMAKVSQIIITAPLYLPPKLLKAVKYVALLVGMVKAAGQEQTDDE